MEENPTISIVKDENGKSNEKGFDEKKSAEGSF